MIKIFTTILTILIFTFSQCYGLSIIERLKMPSNKIYLQKFPMKLNFINNQNQEQQIEKQLKQQNVLENIKLTGILKIGNKFFAILNGESYPVGATINDFKILSIYINKVTLLDKLTNKKVELKIED
jgi:Tfp pilus assembly protein PilP